MKKKNVFLYEIIPPKSDPFGKTTQVRQIGMNEKSFFYTHFVF